MISVDLGKQQALDADPKEIQQISFTGSLRGNKNRLMLFVEAVKESILDFPQRTAKVL